VLASRDPLPAPSPAIREQLAARILDGAALDVAANACGVEPELVDAWMLRGERGGRGNGPFVALRRAVERARGESEANLVAQVAEAATGGSWQAAAWLLERRFGWTRQSIQPAGRKTLDANVGAADPFAELDDVDVIRRPRR
jgi:hypothetical protein